MSGTGGGKCPTFAETGAAGDAGRQGRRGLEVDVQSRKYPGCVACLRYARSVSGQSTHAPRGKVQSLPPRPSTSPR